ncbi:cytochrome P450 [Mycena rebaudengoi]|nr:cytochrome P450 [Mycena rebaudengoi]
MSRATAIYQHHKPFDTWDSILALDVQFSFFIALLLQTNIAMVAWSDLSRCMNRDDKWNDSCHKFCPPSPAVLTTDRVYVAHGIVDVRALWVAACAMRISIHVAAFNELDAYMFDIIKARRESEKKEERYDLFSQLLDASQEETEHGGAQMSDRELVGNIVIFLLAGHETTTHTLCFTFALLALYPEEQDRLYQEIKTLMPDRNRLPTYDEMSSFKYSMARVSSLD